MPTAELSPSNFTDPLPTRRSLLSRLRDAGDSESWREFHDLYERLIRSVARRSGLQDADADEVVQETLLAVAKVMPEFQYDPARGSFKGWLRTITQRRVFDRIRQSSRRAVREDSFAGESDAPGDDAFTAAWDEEWQRHLLSTALRRLAGQTTARQRQIFDLAVVRGLPMEQVQKAVGCSKISIYMARHRVGKLVLREVEKVRAEIG